MTTDILIILSTYLAAISLATERFVVIVKSIIPWLGEERKDAAGLIDIPQERLRTFLVLMISLVGAWITTSLLNSDPNPNASICLDKESRYCWKAGVVALLSTGGSAFWNNLLGYLTAVKDIKKQQRAQQRMDLVMKSNQFNTPINKLPKL